MPPPLDEADNYAEDTIVVKGRPNQPWANLSSPESMSPEVEPLVANLLRQIDTRNEYPRELESPEPEPQPHPQNIPSNTPKSTVNAREPRARRTSQATPRSRSSGNAVPTQEAQLLLMPKKRELPWREGTDPEAANEVGGDSRRKQIRFGCLLATRGEVQAKPCQACAHGRGKFSLCIALDGFFKGACASCQLSGRPNRCTIKKEDDDAENPVADQPPPVPTVRKRKSSNKAQSQAVVEIEEPSKRRRTTDKVPDWEEKRPRWEQELGNSQARQNEMVQSSWVTVNNPIPLAQSEPIRDMNGNVSSQPNTTAHRSSTGWATVNQPPPHAPPPQSYHRHSGSDRSTELRRSFDLGKREDTAPYDEENAPIDLFSKSKQRQIYGLVSGLQGGIDSLQRELNQLRNALGIDDEN